MPKTPSSCNILFELCDIIQFHFGTKIATGSTHENNKNNNNRTFIVSIVVVVCMRNKSSSSSCSCVVVIVIYPLKNVSQGSYKFLSEKFKAILHVPFTSFSFSLFLTHAHSFFFLALSLSVSMLLQTLQLSRLQFYYGSSSSPFLD